MPARWKSVFLLGIGVAWPYLVVSVLAIDYAWIWFIEDPPDPPWWSISAFTIMALALIPLGLWVYGRLPPDMPPRQRLGIWLLRSSALALGNAVGVALYMTILNVALSLPLA